MWRGTRSRPTITRRRLFIYGLLILSLPFILPILAGIGLTTALTHPWCGHGGKPSDYGLPYQHVLIPATSDPRARYWQGYFIAGFGERASSLILVPPPYNSDQGGWLAEANILAKAGYSILTFESVLCARGGAHSLGYLEAGQVGDALDYVYTQAAAWKIDLKRIALHGFSSAGASGLFFSARDTRLAALVTEGHYVNIHQYFGVPANQPLYALSIGAARWSYRQYTGLDINSLDLWDTLARIRQPLLLIYGTQETTPPDVVRRMADTVRGNGNSQVATWFVEGVGHGGYLYGKGGVEAFRRRVLAFYDCTLLGQCGAEQEYNYF